MLLFLLFWVAFLMLLVSVSWVDTEPAGAGFMIVLLTAVIWALYAFDRAYQRRMKERRARAADTRVHELVKQVTDTGQPVEIRGASGFVVAFSCLAVGGLLLYLALFLGNAQPQRLLFSVLSFLGGGMVVAWGAIQLRDAFCVAGKPMLVFSIQGVATPWSGLVGWEDIRGFELRVRDRARRPIGALLPKMHTLWMGMDECGSRQPAFRVPRLLQGWRGMAKGRLRFALVRSSERPEVVYRVAQRLRQHFTGRDFSVWSPGMPDEVYAAFLRHEQRWSKSSELPRPDPDAPPDEVLTYLSAVKDKLEAGTKDWEIINTWLGRENRKMMLTLIVVAVIFIIAVGGLIRDILN